MAPKNTQRTRRRFGSLRTLPSGRVQARYSHAPAPNSPAVSYRAPGTFEDQDAAIAWLKGQERMIDRGDWMPPEEQDRRSKADAVTVAEYVDLYHDRKQISGEIRASTVQTYRNTTNNRIKPYSIADIRITQLTTMDCYRWWDQMGVDHADTPETNRKGYVRLKAAMADAVERSYIEINPVAVKAASKKSKSYDKQLPTTSELKAIVDNVPVTHKVVAVLCAFHGLRVGEALAVRIQDVIFDGDGGACVRVRGNFQRIKDTDGHVKMVRQDAKTSAGERDVPALPQYVDLLRHAVVQARARAHDEAKPNEDARAVRSRREDFLISTTRTGQPIMDTSFRSIWNRARERGGVRDDITPHYGRNWLTVMLAEQGSTPAEIGQVLGQRDISTVVGIYMKVRGGRPADLMRRVAATMDAH
ncbi:tyrosine-type recombinase/integrase [Corynebacterium suedekumii]|uniref:Tyrosine-type recombinase/integrase n=1 Tax=Corynebacterium suedekumii TaxID=3049801 RepID=A0ABY8VHI8_9CORY|nr:site-specific integrase [Corynebacterium suedekumii]WIM69114.1 tyrosine-type recombinase/integrase [Corynebacterium suedekumii]